MTNKTQLALSAARKFGIAMVATGVFTISGGLAAPQNANAWGIGDAFDFVEDVWEIGADGAERLGRAVGEKAQGIGRGTITSNNPPRRRATGKPVAGGNRALPPARGSSRPSTSLPPARGTSSSSALPTGNTALPPARGESSSNSLPTGNTAMPPARGESSSNNSGTALPPSRRRNERIIVTVPQRPTPITEEDVKPPLCNSKFENCSDKHDKKSRKSRQSKQFKNGGKGGKAVWSNKAGQGKKVRSNKRNERKLRIKRNDTKVQNRRGNKITVKHRARTQMKRSDKRNVQVKRSNAKRMIRVKRSDRRG